MGEAGVDRFHIAHVLNHRSVTHSTVTAIYDRYRYDKEKRAALEKWPRYWHHGFRPSKRYIVFQVLPDTLGLGPEVWRVLSKCHDMRNRTEYEGVIDVDERLLADLIKACRTVADKVK